MGNLWVPQFDSSSSSSSSTRSSSTATDDNHSSSALERPPWHHRIRRWFFPYDYQIVQEIHRNDPEVSSRAELREIGSQLTPDEERSYAISQLPQETSKHTGFAFDSPGYESFFALQAGVLTPQKAWDVARRASMRTQQPRTPQN